MSVFVVRKNDPCNDISCALTMQLQPTGRLAGIDIVPCICRWHKQPGLVIKALVKANVESCERFYLHLFCRCSSSLLSKITDISSIRTSFFFPSFRTPEIFCPFSTVTSRISVQGRIQRLNHTSQNDTGSVQSVMSNLFMKLFACCLSRVVPFI